MLDKKGILAGIAILFCALILDKIVQGKKIKDAVEADKASTHLYD